MSERAPSGAWVSAYLAATRLAAPLGEPVLRHRLARGKEHPERWREKLGQTSVPRPGGQLVWMHAVGLGEALALRGLVAELRALRPEIGVLLTSTALSSAEALSRNLPDGALHQFLPLDLPRPRHAFLDHWRPDLSVWAEQDLWPGLVVEAARRGIPLALVNARMNADALRRRSRARGLFAALYGSFHLIAAQDAASARHLEMLGAAAPVRVAGSLKPAAPPLAHDPEERNRLAAIIGSRPVWFAASTHPEDEAAALGAHAGRLKANPDALLILAPRYRERGQEAVEAATAHGLRTALRSRGDDPTPSRQVYVADTVGEMGLWYRLAPVALVGGTFGPVEGHNPWEPARLGAAILHGPRTANFADDYARLDGADAAIRVGDAAALTAALTAPGRAKMAGRARAMADHGLAAVRSLAADLLALIDNGGD